MPKPKSKVFNKTNSELIGEFTEGERKNSGAKFEERIDGEETVYDLVEGSIGGVTIDPLPPTPSGPDKVTLASFIGSLGQSNYAVTGFTQALRSKEINPDEARELAEWEMLYKEIYK